MNTVHHHSTLTNSSEGSYNDPPSHLASRIQELERILGDKEGEVNGLRFQKGECERRIWEKNAEFDRIRSDIDHVDSFKTRIGALEWTLEQRKSELDDVLADKAKLQQVVDQQGNQISALQSHGIRVEQVKLLQRAFFSLREEFKKQAVRIKKQQDLIESKDQELVLVAGRQDTQNVRHVEQLDQLADLLTIKQEEINEVNQRIVELESEEGSPISDPQEVETLRAQIKSMEVLQEHTNNLQWYLGERDAKITDLQTENSRLESEIDERDRRIEALNGEQKNLENLLAEQSEQITKSQNSLRAFKARADKLSKLEQALDIALETETTRRPKIRTVRKPSTNQLGKMGGKGIQVTLGS